MGITTTATDIILDDGTFSTADILAAVTAADALRVDSGTGFPTYRFLKNVVVGGATTNATTYVDTNVCLTFDATRVLRTRTTNTTNVGITFGGKVTSGTVYSGGNGVTVLMAPTTTTAMALRGTIKLYGCRFAKVYAANNQSLQFVVLNSGSEIINTQFDGFTQYALGSSGFPIDLMYNVDVSRPNVAVNIITAFFVTSAQRLTVCSLRTDDSTVALSTATTGISFKDTIIMGDFDGGATPGVLNATGNNPNWVMVRPTFPPGKNKFITAGITTDPDTGCHEYWHWGVKCVTGDGAGVSGIPVKLTDSDNNVQVNTTTDAYGEVTFGTGDTTEMVIVADHYNNGTAYTIRDRSPFLVEVNMPYQTGYNPNYFSHRYYFRWPGSETVTTTDGTFEDLDDVFQMSAVTSGGGSTWTETTVP